MSQLEGARGEALASRLEAEVARLREKEAELLLDREALMQELALEKGKSRQHEADRRAYGRIRRFIERHSGGEAL
ncbi:unnamed protein product, partial [Discosporangium mesarthrocarpum]